MIHTFASALWQLYQHRTTTLMCILSLAVGVTLIASTASIVDHALFRPLPFHEPDRLVMLRAENSQQNVLDDQVSVVDFGDWESDCRTMDMAVFALSRIDLPHEGGYQRLVGMYISPTFFDVLRIRPYLGVDLRDYERTGHWKQIMLSPDVWRSRLDGDLQAIGNTVEINSWASYPNPGSLSFQLTGLLPEDMPCVPSRSIFVDDRGVGIDRKIDFVLPISMKRGQYGLRGFRSVDAIGRLKNNVSVAQAQAEMDLISDRLAKRFPISNEGWRVRVIPLREYVAGDARPIVLATLLAAFLVYVIANANVVHMMLVQYQQRQGEMAIRGAVGALPHQLVGQVVAEFVVMVSIGFAAGIWLASWCTPILLLLAPEKLRWLPTMLSINAIACAAILISFSGMIVWWLALRRVVSPNLIPLLGVSGKTSSADLGSTKALCRMTQIQLMATYALIVAAGVLFLRMRQLAAVDPGFEPQQRLSISLSLPAAKYDWNHNSVFNHAVVERLRETPGIVDAAIVLGMPMGNNPLTAQITVEGRPHMRPGDLPAAYIRVVSDTYFKTMGIPMVMGRTFDASDAIGEIGVNRTAIISKTMADRCWPGLDPIGRRFKPYEGSHWMEIVGVVGDVHSGGIEKGPAIDVYYPEKLFPQSSPNLVVHTEVEPMAMIDRIRAAIWSVDVDANIFDIRTMESVIIDSQAERYFGLRLLSLLSIIGFALAVAGVVATATHSVASRADELMIRVACGATPTDIIRLVVWEQAKLVLVAIVLSVVAAAALGPRLGLSWPDMRLFRQLALFGVPALLVVASLLSALVIAAKTSLVIQRTN